MLTAGKKASPLKLLFNQFTDIMVIILMISTAISAFMGEITEAVTIIAIVTINALLGFIQEYRTERTMEALKSLTAPGQKSSGRPAGQHTCRPGGSGDLLLLGRDRIAAVQCC